VATRALKFVMSLSNISLTGNSPDLPSNVILERITSSLGIVSIDPVL